MGKAILHVEATAFAVSGNTLNIAYSTGRWENSTYKSGDLTASINADPMNPASWTKSEKPIQQTGNGLVGPGSGTLFNDNQGNTIWCFDAVTGLGFSQRDIYTQKAYFDSNGKLVLQ